MQSTFRLKFAVILLTALPIHSMASDKADHATCPTGTTRVYQPSNSQPLWSGCVDKSGFYQGVLVQYSNQTEIVRIAGVKNSHRQGKEIRMGVPGTLEERHYVDGHLHGPSYLFKSNAYLGQLLPKPVSLDLWTRFENGSTDSILKNVTKTEPFSTVYFENGRMVRIQASRNTTDSKNGKPRVEKTDWQFKVTGDGRMMAINHPEMKGLFFIDPEALWYLNASDFKKALLPGFGSCKKYAGPIGRVGRHYDHLLYKREANEKSHIDKLKEIRDRFINFCVPEDIRENLGVLECPPQLPSPNAPNPCLLPISDQVRMPYHPKFFKYEFTLKKSPEEFQKLLISRGLYRFLNSYATMTDTIDLVGKKNPSDLITLKKTGRGIRWRPFQAKQNRAEDDKEWWEWKGIPGY